MTEKKREKKKTERLVHNVFSLLLVGCFVVVVGFFLQKLKS